MGIFFKKPFIDVVEWSPQSKEVIYAYRHPENNLSTATQLIVRESQVALLFSKGQLLGKFGPGKHTLTTENLPLLREWYGFLTGGVNPFFAEVWFVNLVNTFAIDWEIEGLPIFDNDYQTQVPLIARGQYGLKVVDPEKFVIKFVGTLHKFTEEDMTTQSMGEICSKTKSMILQYMLTNKIGFMQIAAYLDNISMNLRQSMASFWPEVGLELTKFYVNSIEVDKSTAEGRKISEAMSQQAAQKITGRTWQQEQMFGTANNAIDGLTGAIGGSSNGGLLGGLMAIQMMNGMSSGNMGGVASGMMQPAYGQPAMGGAGNDNAGQALAGPGGGIRPVYCASCSKKYMSNQAFCPHCGHKYNPCPKCGSDNADKAKRCVSCGTQLMGGAQAGSSSFCQGCGAPLAPGAMFCANCGTRAAMADDNRCSRCGTEMQPGAKFCPVCGNKR